ncbi:MAG TPA: L-rhamnose mutarotase [Candidatus Hydrogenedentes bacterium]|nr:L-rhamnose mutarotase [Candidatus Hydrogenedentota bacterium]HPK02081.1 L-rhamnose mutarotase [Candidatus Sumerlaeota bacterium]
MGLKSGVGLAWMMLTVLLGGTGCQRAQVMKGEMMPQRYCMILGLQEGALDEYAEYHRDVWPDVLDALRSANLTNYSIYVFHADDGLPYLVGYFEYVGSDFESDMARIGELPVIKRWNDTMSKLQRPIDNRKDGEWWAAAEELFHME